MAQKTRSCLLLKIVSLALLALAIYALVVTIIGFVKLDSFADIGSAVLGNIIKIVLILVTFFAGWFGFTARRKTLCYLLGLILFAFAIYCLVLDLVVCTSVSAVIASIIANILYIVLSALYLVGLRKSA